MSLSGRRIGLFGRGGAGKSTLAVLLAKALCQRGYTVCVLDADSTNVGLFQLFNIKQSPKSMLDYFGGMVFSGGVVTCPVDDPLPLVGADINLEKLPTEYYAKSPDGIILLVAGKIGSLGPGAGCDGPVAKIARDLQIHTQGQSPVTLVDFKAGFEDTARGVLTSLDDAIVVIDPTAISIEMAASMKHMFEQILTNVLPATAHLKNPELIAWANKIFTEARIKNIWFVLNRIKNLDAEQYLHLKLKEKEIIPVGVVQEDPSISLSWLKGTPIVAGEALLDVQGILNRLEDT